MVTLKVGTRPPWVGLGAAVWLQIASGNAYNFPLYSHSLKSVLGFNQRQLTVLGVANDIGENVGLLPGIACNKFPPWVVLLIGAFACFFGYGVLWLAVSRTVESLPYWLSAVKAAKEHILFDGLVVLKLSSRFGLRLFPVLLLPKQSKSVYLH
uniref:Nodulin-like domain-containing protein n=1 Tax=Davidia involucrata TaxID=16924 RepID=A0A5B7BE08_DAVIN